jgi:sec-independent protein translocase protein TatC
VDDTRQPLTTHLAELRSRLFRILIAWAAGAIASWEWREEIFGFLLRPAVRALGPNGALQAIAPGEIFMTYLKCSALAGFVLALPVIFWQVWAFVAPGLYPSEKKTALPFVLVSTVLFAGGAAFGYTFVFPAVYLFFAGFSSEFVEAAWTMHEVFGMTTRLFLAFGVGFELPVVMFFVAASGLVEPRRLLSGMKYGVLICFVIGAVLTPPDVVSQVMLAVPLTVLYAIGVGAGWLASPRRRAAADAASDAGHADTAA